MEAVKKTVKDFPFLALAGGAFAIASKVSKEVYEVDTLYGILMRGEAKIGAGNTAELLKGKYTPGVPLKGACPIVTDNHLGLHDAALVDWRSAYGTYAAATTIGAIIFAGDAEGFATWAKSKPCRDEVAGVPDGRLFALIDGYIVNVDAQSGAACATVANGKGSVVWADGNYYVGEIKDGPAARGGHLQDRERHQVRRPVEGRQEARARAPSLARKKSGGPLTARITSASGRRRQEVRPGHADLGGRPQVRGPRRTTEERMGKMTLADGGAGRSATASFVGRRDSARRGSK